MTTSITKVLPGFHRHIKEWWVKVVERGHDINAPGSGTSGRERRERPDRAGADRKTHAGNTVRTDKIYLAEDKQVYGELVPAICAAGDMRISRPEIMHGSACNKDLQAD